MILQGKALKGFGCSFLGPYSSGSTFKCRDPKLSPGTSQTFCFENLTYEVQIFVIFPLKSTCIWRGLHLTECLEFPVSKKINFGSVGWGHNAMLQLFIVPVKQGQSDLQDGINSLDCHDSIHFLLLHHLLFSFPLWSAAVCCFFNDPCGRERLNIAVL